jgi:hypothetical protein
MPEETPAPEQEPQETPEESGPEDQAPAESTEDSQPDSDYQKRYEDLRPQYDRTSSELDQYRRFISSLQDPETQAQALEALGLELEGDEDEEEDDYGDFDEDPRVDRIEQYLAEQAEAQQEAEADQLEQEWLDKELKRISKDENVEFSDEEQDAILHLADSMRDEDDVPDVAAAYSALSKAVENGRKRYVESKKAPKVEVGQPGQEKVDLSDDDSRVNALASVIEAAKQAEE